MKVMFVNGSSHLRGTTMAAIEEMEKVFGAEGIETEVIQVGGKPIADCLQCNVCGKTGKCVFTDFRDGAEVILRSFHRRI